MNGKMTLKGIAILAAVLVLFNISVSSYIFFSGPYERAVVAYKKGKSHSEEERIGMCFYCRKRISYANGYRIFRFTLNVKEAQGDKKVPVVYRVSAENGSYQVEF